MASPVLNPHGRYRDVRRFKGLHLGQHFIASTLGSDPEPVRPGGWPGRAPNCVRQLGDHVLCSRAVKYLPLDAVSPHHFDPGHIRVAGTDIQLYPPCGIEQNTKTAYIMVVGHGEVGGVFITDSNSRTSVAPIALFVHKKSECLASLIGRVVLLAEAVKGAVFIAAYRDCQRIGCGSRQGEAEQ